MQAHRWRKVFIELSESIFRELGFSPPSMIFEESLPLSMELTLEGHAFELLHSENDLHDHILVVCTLGSIPHGMELRGYRELMKKNLLQIRTANEYFGIDSQNRSLKLIFLYRLDSSSAVALLEQMKNVVIKWKSWEEQFFFGDRSFAESLTPGGSVLLA